VCLLWGLLDVFRYLLLFWIRGSRFWSQQEIIEAVHSRKIAAGIPAIVLAGLQRDVLLMISLRGTALKAGVIKEWVVQQAEPMGWNGKERFITEKLETAYLEEKM